MKELGNGVTVLFGWDSNSTGSGAQAAIGFIIFLVSVLFMLAGAACANIDSFLTPGQMIQKRGITQGLPFMAHGGMWGDLFIISPLLCLIYGLCGNQWSGKHILWAIAIGVVASVIMHLTYIMSNTMEAHVQNHKLTPAGWVHTVYMALALSAFILFYFFTPTPISWLVVMTSILLVIHLVIGTHVVLGLVAPEWYPDKPLSNPATWATILGGAALLAWRSWYLIG